VNDRPVNIGTLQAVGNYLVDVHGQHEHQSLLSSTPQRGLLDGFGGHEALITEITDAHARWRELTARRESQRMSEQEKQRLIDLYSFQLRDIEAAKLVPGEEEEIEAGLPQLKNAEKLRELSEEANLILYDSEGAVLEKLGKVQRLLETIQGLGGGIGETAETLKNACYSLEEVARDVEHLRDRLKADPEKLNELLERQDLVRRLKKKYGVSVQDILAYADKISKELSALANADQDRQELDREIEKAQAHLFALCTKLSAARKKAGEKLAQGVEKELADLGMKKARFSVAVEKQAEPGTDGWDRVEFLFSANPGEDIKPLKNIASGGEMSRVMLALKTVLAKADRVPVLIFDEIDAGIGGPMGQTVGKKLFNLSHHYQVLCITHLPQIAAFGNQHIAVDKATKSGRTITRVKTLTSTERVEEIARMLSGEEITPAARKHASELLQTNR
jgi:DNA repair protein RecN (Recombination protein N)